MTAEVSSTRDVVCIFNAIGEMFVLFVLDWGILLSDSPQVAHVGLERRCGTRREAEPEGIRHLVPSALSPFPKTALPHIHKLDQMRACSEN